MNNKTHLAFSHLYFANKSKKQNKTKPEYKLYLPKIKN